MKWHWIYGWYTRLALSIVAATAVSIMVVAAQSRDVWMVLAVLMIGIITTFVLVVIVGHYHNRWLAQWRLANGVVLTWTIGPNSGFSSPTLTLRSIELIDGTTIPFDEWRVPEFLLTGRPVAVTYQWCEVKGVKQFQCVALKAT